MIKSEHSNIKEIILKATNELVDFVKPTYGPAGNKVLIQKPYMSHVIDDGVSIARDYQSDDIIRNAVISIIKEVAIRTNDRVGDGTTSSLIMLQALMNEISKSNKKVRDIVEELEKGLVIAREQLKSKSKAIKTESELSRIANISYNNPHIAKIIADLIFKLGTEAVITVENSNTKDTYSERIEGIEVSTGFVSPYMVNTDRMECEMSNPYVFITDYRFTSGIDMLEVMKVAKNAGCNELFVVAEHVEGDALSTIITNKIKGAMNVLAIEIPHGDKTEFVHDLCVITGAEPMTHDKNVDFTKLKIEQFGKCKKVISKQDKTMIVGGAGKKKDIENAIKSLRAMIGKETDPHRISKLELRLSKFTNGISVIKIGASTESELKALKYKVEDAINAVKSAYKGGVVCGAGLSLSRLKTSSPILDRALKYPFKQLCVNSEIDCDVNDLKNNEAINAVTGEIGDYMKLGIIDPVDVLIAGIESAISITSLLITTKGIIYDVPEQK